MRSGRSSTVENLVKHFEIRAACWASASSGPVRACGRAQLQRAQGRDTRPRREFGLRQDDARQAHPAPDPGHVRQGDAEGQGPLRHPDGGREEAGPQGDAPLEGRDEGRPARPADGLPGPVRLAQPAHDRRRDRRRGPLGPRPARTAPAQACVAELLERVGLPRATPSRYPHEFSGGQRQRIGIARALALHPDFIVCDEPVSALDVSIQARSSTCSRPAEELGLTYLFIAHNLAVVEHFSDRVRGDVPGHAGRAGRRRRDLPRAGPPVLGRPPAATVPIRTRATASSGSS